MDGYGNTIRGGLKLKSGTSVKKTISKKKQQKEPQKIPLAIPQDVIAAADPVSVACPDVPVDDDVFGLQDRDECLTTAEKAFRLAQKKRELQRTSTRSQLSHRQRMERFNAHLSSLSEHFDIPKVGPG